MSVNNYNYIWKFSSPEEYRGYNLYMNVQNSGTNIVRLIVVDIKDNDGNSIKDAKFSVDKTGTWGTSTFNIPWIGKYVSIRKVQTKNKLVGFRYETEYKWLVVPVVEPPGTGNKDEWNATVNFVMDQGGYKNPASGAWLYANPGPSLFSLGSRPPIGSEIFDMLSKEQFEKLKLNQFTNGLKLVGIPSGIYFISNYNTYNKTDSTSINSIKIEYWGKVSFEDPAIGTTYDADAIYFAFIKIGENFLYVNKDNSGKFSLGLTKTVTKDNVKNFIFVLSNTGKFYNYENKKYLVPISPGSTSIQDITLSDEVPTEVWMVTKFEPKTKTSESLWTDNMEKWMTLSSTAQPDPSNPIDFCAQHDTKQNTVFFNSRSFQTCIEWADQNPKGRLQALKKYCRKEAEGYGFRKSDICKEDTCDRDCITNRLNYCNNTDKKSPQAISSDDCLYYCQVYATDTDKAPCQKRINEYCSGKISTLLVNDTTITSKYSDFIDQNTKKLCGTYLNDDFYKNYYDALKINTNIEQIIKDPSPNPICFFPFSNPNNIEPLFKGYINPTKKPVLDSCTAIQSCFQVATVDEKGNPTSPIIVSSDPICKEFKVNEVKITERKEADESVVVGGKTVFKGTTWSLILTIVFGIIFAFSVIYFFYTLLSRQKNVIAGK